jgi:hypothetical protein
VEITEKLTLVAAPLLWNKHKEDKRQENTVKEQESDSLCVYVYAWERKGSITNWDDEL